jgi:hypothetical protein
VSESVHHEDAGWPPPPPDPRLHREVWLSGQNIKLEVKVLSIFVSICLMHALRRQYDWRKAIM